MFVMAMLIEVHPDNCRGCRLCEMACSFRHEQECSTAKSRIRILKDSAWAFDCPLLCIHCAEAPCIVSCPSEALSRNGITGAVAVDAESCVGCGECITACPLHALYLNGETGTVFKCDLCGGDPECVKWCSHNALVWKEVNLDAPERKAYLDKAVQMKGEMEHVSERQYNQEDR
jgi:anaerobic carbon-monoxide dehydrogenase iron sulfur subunit